MKDMYGNGGQNGGSGRGNDRGSYDPYAAYGTYGGYNGRGEYDGYAGRGFGGADAEREEMERKMAHYSSMDRGALEDELAKEAAALRERGMLDVGKLEEFCNMAAPFMTADQLRRMREIIDTLR